MIRLKPSIFISLAFFAPSQVWSGGDVYDSSLDINQDGVQDIRYEYENDGYYELVDTNFDGRVDLASFYNNDDNIVRSKSDDDFDGILETTTIYEQSRIKVVGVDSNANLVNDIVFSYDEGILQNAFRCHLSDSTNVCHKVGGYRFEFGYPIAGEFNEASEISEGEFEDRYWDSNK